MRVVIDSRWEAAAFWLELLLIIFWISTWLQWLFQSTDWYKKKGHSTAYLHRFSKDGRFIVQKICISRGIP
jgi:hypothetical protein